jgi:hypothetical protein
MKRSNWPEDGFCQTRERACRRTMTGHVEVRLNRRHAPSLYGRPCLPPHCGKGAHIDPGLGLDCRSLWTDIDTNVSTAIGVLLSGLSKGPLCKKLKNGFLGGTGAKKDACGRDSQYAYEPPWRLGSSRDVSCRSGSGRPQPGLVQQGPNRVCLPGRTVPVGSELSPFYIPAPPGGALILCVPKSSRFLQNILQLNTPIIFQLIMPPTTRASKRDITPNRHIANREYNTIKKPRFYDAYDERFSRESLRSISRFENVSKSSARKLL